MQCVMDSHHLSSMLSLNGDCFFVLVTVRFCIAIGRLNSFLIGFGKPSNSTKRTEVVYTGLLGY